MVEGLKPYPEYKAAGVSWLGKIPGHWAVEPGFAAYRENHQKNLGMVEKRVLSLSYGRIVVKPEEKLHGLVPESFETYQIVEPGDIIIRSTDLQNDWTSLRVGLVHDRGIITSAYLCLKMVGPISSEYGYLQLHTLDLLKVFYGMGSGLRQNLDFSDFKRITILVPPRDEQDAIVRFLDYANRRIERYIRAKKKLIALLNEQKQAIIHRAVTRGLDPNIRLKPSGIPCLGEIPEHWKLVRAKQIAQVFIPQRDKPELNEREGFPWITPVNVGEIFICRVNLFVTQSALVSAGSRVLPAGSVIASCVGRFGITSVTEVPVIINQQLQAYIPSHVISAKYLRHCVQVTRPYFEAIGNSTTLAYVDRQGFGSMPLPLPPRDEQETIERFLETEFVETEQTIVHAQREIALMSEYRTRLVADVVTGQLDVRAAVTRLPEEPEAETELVVESTGDDNEASEFEDMASSGTIG